MVEPSRGRYVLITPARDEADNIARLIESVLTQSIPPSAWVIVDDGSVDGTAEIARLAAAGERCVTVVSLESRRPADFASKARAFAAGVETIGDRPHDFIGNLDADLSLNPDYFETVLEQFATRPRLGIGGGKIVEVVDAKHRPQRSSATSVAGAVQMFRRACFEEVCPYLALPLGGEDAAAEILARMHGWEVATFSELRVVHHGRMLNRKRSASGAFFARGKVNHSLGYDPLFHVLASGVRMGQPPYVVGGMLMVTGYAWAAVTGRQRSLPDAAVAFLRGEQRTRMRRFVRRS